MNLPIIQAYCPRPQDVWCALIRDAERRHGGAHPVSLAMAHVLGLPFHATAGQRVAAVMAEPRSSEELAFDYLEAWVAVTNRPRRADA